MEHIGQYLKSYLDKYPQGLFRENEPMKDHTSFKIGGRAPVMFFPGTEEETAFLVTEARRFGIKPLVIGNGSNLLVTDEDLTFPVIKTGEGMKEIKLIEDGVIEAQCGALLSSVAVLALREGLAGFEFAHGIPGTLGGAVMMNAGAYGGEMKDVVLSVRALCADGVIREFSGEENEFSYRHSRYSDSEDIVLSARIKLTSGDREKIKARMEELGAKRRASQPLTLPSAGSTFKRPAGGYAAALIQEAGLKGYTIGGAQVSEKHSGFVVNIGGASFDDVISLMAHIKETVLKKSGIELTPEVKIIR